MNILGVDPSLTATAFCGPSDWRMYTLDEEVSSIKRNEMRLIKIRRRMIDLATHADLVVIEGRIKFHTLSFLQLSARNTQPAMGEPASWTCFPPASNSSTLTLKTTTNRTQHGSARWGSTPMIGWT